MTNRQNFIDGCKEFNLAFLGSRWHRLQYKRKGNGEKIGCVVVFEREGRKFIGVSKCSKTDKFDKHIGIRKAISTAIDLETSLNRSDNIPKSMLPLFKDVAGFQLRKNKQESNHAK